jgi:DNA processing protein
MQQSNSKLSAQLVAWLRLIQLPGLGAVTLKQLWQALGSAEALVRASKAELLELGFSANLASSLAKAAPLSGELTESLERWLQQPQHRLLSLDDPQYPPQLMQLDDPPPLLYVVGDPQLLGYPQLALVGSRNASAQGLIDAQRFARQLSEAGLVPTSGLALGIDGAAHRGALEGLGLTVAVLGTGIDRIYPARHRQLAQQIVDQGGALVSELPLGTAALAHNFPKRNRIISGLSLGVLVIEAALQSGSLISARLAAEQGREVFALPGSIHNPVSRGCHQLIRQGAVLVSDTQQIIDELAAQLPLRPAVRREPSEALEDAGLSSSEQQLISALGWEPVALDLLVIRVQQPVAQLQAGLLALELRGLVVTVAGGYQRTKG